MKNNTSQEFLQTIYETGLYNDLLADLLYLKNKKKIQDYNTFMLRSSKELKDPKSKNYFDYEIILII